MLETYIEGDPLEPSHLTIEQLSVLADGQLARDEREALEAHISGCPECQHQLTQMRQTVATLRAMPGLQAPRSFRISAADVAQPPRPAVPEPKRSSIIRPIWLQALSGVAAAFMVV